MFIVQNSLDVCQKIRIKSVFVDSLCFVYSPSYEHITHIGVGAYLWLCPWHTG